MPCTLEICSFNTKVRNELSNNCIFELELFKLVDKMHVFACGDLHDKQQMPYSVHYAKLHSNLKPEMPRSFNFLFKIISMELIYEVINR